jgi:hypothetical protein
LEVGNAVNQSKDTGNCIYGFIQCPMYSGPEVSIHIQRRDRWIDTGTYAKVTRPAGVLRVISINPFICNNLPLTPVVQQYDRSSIQLVAHMQVT